MATPEQMTAAVHAYVEAFDKGDPELAVALFAEDACIEIPGTQYYLDLFWQPPVGHHPGPSTGSERVPGTQY